MTSSSVTTSDKEIVRQVLHGNTERFNELVLRYQNPLLRLAYTKLNDRVLAEGAVQETFLAAFKSLDTYKAEFGFRTWLWTILLDQCRRHGQRNQKKAEREISRAMWCCALRLAPARQLEFRRPFCGRYPIRPDALSSFSLDDWQLARQRAGSLMNWTSELETKSDMPSGSTRDSRPKHGSSPSPMACY